MLTQRPTELLLIVLIILMCPLAEASQNPITIYQAKKIYTMNPMLPNVSAVAVQNGKVISVGTLKSFKLWLKNKPYTVDDRFKNKIITPGFVEPHAHPLLAGIVYRLPSLSYYSIPRPYGKSYVPVKTKQQAIARLKQYISALKKPTQPLIVTGYDILAMDNGKFTLDKHTLDKISTTHPIIISDSSIHNLFLNSAALKLHPLTPQELLVQGVNREKSGELTGVFEGATASIMMSKKLFSHLTTPTQNAKTLKYITDLSRKFGITTTSELAMGVLDWKTELNANTRFFNAKTTPMRCVVVSFSSSLVKTYGKDAVNKLESLEDQSTNKLIFNGVKFFSDDAFLSLNMKMKPPGYFDGHHGLYLTPPKFLYQLMLPWWNANQQIHVHSNGDAGNQVTLNALAKLQLEKPRFDHRFTFEHLGIVTPYMIKKMSKLGALASVNPYYLYYRSDMNEAYIGADRADTTIPLKTLLDNDVTVSLHADMPVAPPAPLEKVWIAVNRIGMSGKVKAPSERISVYQAMKMITIDAAYTLGIDDKVGSIETGKFADFTVLDDDPFTVDKAKIKDIHVWGTVFDGKVYPSSQIKP